MKNTVFITGANGFVGKHLVQALRLEEIDFIAGERSLYGDLETQNQWSNMLKDVNAVVHLAARVHIMKESSLDPFADFRKVNVEATMNLARAAKASGVRRFIFISTVKVNGERTFGKPFSADDQPKPEDPYGISKMEAEKELLTLHTPDVFEVVIIRPPLIYGPEVKGNLAKLFSLVKIGAPLPFGSVNNKRSIISVFNLVDLILLCLEAPQASGQVFMASDGVDLSLKQLLDKMARVVGKKAFLVPVPTKFMSTVATLLGKKSYADRLLGNLQVDIGKTKSLLGWKPKFGFEDTFNLHKK
jgi:nucleoside-diphosphate-sugar epimerase